MNNPKLTLQNIKQTQIKECSNIVINSLHKGQDSKIQRKTEQLIDDGNWGNMETKCNMRCWVESWARRTEINKTPGEICILSNEHE